MTKQKQLIKRMSILFVLLIMFVTILSATTASAFVKPFELDIPANGDLCRTSNRYLRDTSTIQDAWEIKFVYSDEDPSVKTKTTFWLGIYNPNGINPLGSQKQIVLEDSGWHYYSAYAAASKKEVYLYASDNGTKNKLYSVSGKWAPYSGHRPEN